MAKSSSVARNKKREVLRDKFSTRRANIKKRIMDKTLSVQERFEAQIEMQKLPKNSNPIRVRNRCEVTGRPRGYYRRFQMSRIALRELGNQGKVPGIVKSSW